MLVKTAVESYLGTQRHYLQLEQVRYLTYTAAICWIAVQLWRMSLNAGHFTRSA